MARHGQAHRAEDKPNWDPLWFLDGHLMRKELDRVMVEFVMDGDDPDDQLVERSHREFQSMVERFANENGSRFWGRRYREHLGSGGPIWPDNARSITRALRWVFQEVEERQRQKLIAEEKRHGRGQHWGDQQATTRVGGDLFESRSTNDSVDSVQFGGRLYSDELVSHARQERHILDTLKPAVKQERRAARSMRTPGPAFSPKAAKVKLPPSNTPTGPLDALDRVLDPTFTTSGRKSPNVKSERLLSFGDDGERSNDSALVFAKFREITQDGRRQPKRKAPNALQDNTAHLGDGANNTQGPAVVKKSKRSTAQDGSSELKDVVMKTNSPQQTQPSKHQQWNTTVHFFLSDPNLGAIPVSLHDCMTRHTFLAEAVTAWHGLESGSSNPTLLSVRFDWAPVPMVIKWKDKAGFRMMLEAIAAAPCWQKLDHHCHIEVRCVKRQA